MTDIQERQEREAEIVRLELQLFAYARNHDTPGDDYYRKYVRRNAMILDYGKTYGTDAQARLKKTLDDAREKFLARAQELEETADIKDTDEVEELRKQVRLYREALRYYRDQLNDARDKAGILSYAIDIFTDRHPEYSAELKELIDHCESALEDDE